MAKVSLASDLDPNDITQQIDDELTQPNGTLDALSYKIINNPKQMFLVPNITSGILTTPYYGLYVGDPTSIDASKYFESHNSSQPDNYIPVSKTPNKTYAYCIENANLTPRQGTATIAVINGIFTPGGSALIYDNIADAVAATPRTTDVTYGTTFYRLWIPPYDDNGSPAGGDYDLPYFLDNPENDPTNYEAYLQTQHPNLAAADYDDIIISEYTNGQCYYRLPLENEANTLAPYTVKRNSYYMIDIKKVSGPGYTDEDGGGIIDPTDPLDAQTHIKVSIKVEDWDPVNQGGSL